MTTERDALESTLTRALDPMGVRAVGSDRKVRVDDGRDGYTIRLANIAKHDRSPIDRTKDIEAAATALLDAMHVHLDEVRMPHGSSSAVVNAAYRLRELVSAKPGAAAWRRNGYGEDPPEVRTAPAAEVLR